MSICNDCGSIANVHGPATVKLCIFCYDTRIKKADHYNKTRVLKDYILELRILAEMGP